MFERFIKRSYHLSCHRKGPHAEERRRYLEHLYEEGRSFSTLKQATGLLLSIARLIPADRGLVGLTQIECAAKRWLRSPRREFRSEDSRHSAKCKFLFYAKGWLRFLGRLDSRTAEVPYQSELDAFVQFQCERELSSATVARRRRQVGFFLAWLAKQKKPLLKATADDISFYFRSATPG